MATTSGVAGINRVVFSGQDFQTFFDESQDFMETNFPGTFDDFVQNSLGTALLDQNAWAAQSLAFYINRRITDLYLPTAVSPTNVAKLARLLGYKPQGAQSAIATLAVTLNKGPYTFPVSISKGFKFNGPNATIWEYIGDVPVTFQAGQTTQNIDVNEGQTFTNIFVSGGQNGQVFTLNNVASGKFLEQGSVEVVINGAAWTEAPVIPFDTVNQFEVNTTQAPPTIKFGDGVQGNVPPAGVQITVKYRSITGLQGRVGSGQIKTAKDTLVVQFTKIDLGVVQLSGATGGLDQEDIRLTKVNAPKFFRSQDVCVTKSDYDTVAGLFPGVANADAQIIRGITNEITINSYLNSLVNITSGISQSACSGTLSGVSIGIAEQVNGLYSYLNVVLSDTCKSNTVQVQVLSEDVNHKYVDPSDSLLTNLQRHLQARADAVHTVVCVTGSSKIVTAYVFIRVRVNPLSVTPVILGKIGNALYGSSGLPYGLLVKRDFGDSLHVSDIQQAIFAAVEPGEVLFANVRITSPVSLLDGGGNLIIAPTQVIQGDVDTVDLFSIG